MADATSLLKVKKLLSFSLICDCGLSSSDSCGITEISVGDRLQVLIEFIHERYSGRNVEVENIGIRDVVEMLDQSTE